MEHRDETIYCAAAHRVVFGDSRSYVYLPATGAVTALGAHDLALLGACLPPRTLRAHAAAITAARPALLPLVSSRLEELVRQQLLIPAGNSAPRAAARVEVIGIPTAGRPEMLQRCLQAIAGAARARPLRVMVTDGSRSSAHQEENRRIAAAAAASSPGLTVDYVGTAAARAFLDPLLPPAARGLESGLLPGSIGANRNLLLLLAAGRPLLMVDDDIIFRPVGLAPAADSRVALSGCEDTRRVLFRRERGPAIAAATEAVDAAEVDLFQAFESLLGISLLQAAAHRSPAPGAEPCAHFQSALSERSQDFTCRLVCAGIAGDCATSSPVFAWGTEAVKAALLADPAQFAEALASPNGVRIAGRPTLTHGLGCMAYCLAMDNASLLPPFLPWVRNEDGVFGGLLEILMPTAMSAVLPWGVVHDSQRANGPVAFEGAWRPGVGDLVIKLVSMAAGVSRFGAPADRLAAAGAALMRLAEGGEAGLRECVVELSLSRLRYFLSRISEWRDVFAASGIAIDELRAAVLRSTAQGFTAPPRDLAQTPYENSWEGLRHLLRDFGALLAQWPALWASAEMATQERAAAQATAP